MQDRIEELFDEYLEAVFAQRTVGLEQFLSDHPELGDEERRRLCVLAAALKAREPAPELPRDFGPYRLLRVLGRGGQGVVYLAQDTRLSRPVALKVLDRPDLAAFADSTPTGPTARFRREAEVASKLDHPGICVVYEMGVVGQSPYVAMRYIEGETLARKIASAREAGWRMLSLGERPMAELADEDSSASRRREALRRITQLVEQAARALHVAHQSGVIHRDIKPANIMVTGAGQPVLLDFGLARDQASDSLALTQTGEIFGSPSYMSCEQVSPRLGALDRRTDVYSLGVVLYECLTLRRPFEHPTREGLFRAILCEDPPDPRRLNAGVDRELAVVLETALEKDRDRRYKTALELAEDLRRWREYEPILARPASPLLRVQRWTQRNRVLALSALAILALLLGALVASRSVIERQAADARRTHSALLAANSVDALRRDPALALRLAIEGARLSPGLEANNALHSALSRIRERRTIQECGLPITGIVTSPDGKYAISASMDGLARVWDVASWTTVARLRGPTRELNRIDMSADGQLLAAISVPDGKLFVWSAAAWSTGPGVEPLQPKFTFDLSPDTGSRVSLSPDGERVLTWGLHGVRVRDLRGGWIRGRDFPEGTSGSAFWDHSGRRVMLVGQDQIWYPASDESVRLQGRVSADPADSSGDFSPDGLFVVTAFEQGGARVWNTSDGSLALALDARGRTKIARFSPDGRTIFTGSAERMGALFDARTGELLHECPGHSQGISDAAYSRDGLRITTISQDGSARVWNAQTGAEVAALLCSSTFTSCCEIGDGTRLLTGHADGTLRLWDRDDGWARGTLAADLPRDSYLAGCFDPSGSRVALSAGNEVRIYDSHSQAPLGVLRGHEKRVHSVVFTPDGRSLLTSSEDSTVRVWDAASFQQTGLIGSAEHKLPVWCVDVSPDGRLAVTASEDPCARLFDLRSNTLLREFRHAEGCGLKCAHFSPDSRFVVSTSKSEGDRSIRVWDVQSGEPRFGPIRSEDPDDRPMVCRFSPDGTLLVLGTLHGTVAVADATNGHTIWNKRPGSAIINDVSISPDGSLVVSGSTDQALCLWDAGTGRPLAKLAGHNGDVDCALFSPDGGQILSIASDLTAHLWPSNPLKAAIERNPRALTAEEEAIYELTPLAPR